MTAISVVRQLTVRARSDGTGEASRQLQEFGRAAGDAGRTASTAMTAVGGAAAVAGGAVVTMASTAGGAFDVLDRSVALRAVSMIARINAIVSVSLLAVAAIKGVRDLARDEMGSLARIGDVADRAGVGTTLFQSLTEEAKKLRLETSEVERALLRFRDQSTERLGGPSAIRARLINIYESRDGINASGNGLMEFEGAVTGDQRLRAVLASMQELDKQGQRLAALDLAETAFGGGRLVERLREGTLTFAGFLAAAEAANARVAPYETIRRAQELRDRYDDSTTAVRDGLKPALEDLVSIGLGVVSIGVRFSEAIGNAAKWAGDVYVSMRDATAEMRTRTTQLYGRVLERAEPYAPFVTRALRDDSMGIFHQPTPEEVARQNGPWGPAGRIDPRLSSALMERADQMRRGMAATGRVPTLDGTWSPPSIPQPGNMPDDVDQLRQTYNFRRDAADRARAAGDAAARERQQRENAERSLFRSIARRTEGVSAEVDNFGADPRVIARARVERELLTQAEMSGLTVTDELRAKIGEASTRYSEMDGRLTSLRRSQEEFNGLLRYAGNEGLAFVTDFFAGGESSARRYEMAIKRLTTEIGRMIFMGDGAFGFLNRMGAQDGQVGGIFGAIGRLFTGGGGGTPTIPNLYDGFGLGSAHSGGVAGLGGFGPWSRLTPYGVTAHSGFGPTEFPARLEYGETVLTKALSARTLRLMDGMSSAMSSAAPSVQIVNHNDFRGAQASAIPELKAYINQQSRAAERNAVETVGRLNRDNPGFAGR